MNSQELKVGDLVSFSFKNGVRAKTGQVVQINDNGTCDVYVMKENRAYNVALDRVKKL